MKRYILTLCSIALLLVPVALDAAKPAKNQKVENVILMIGDGMGAAQITALMIENEYRPINMERVTTGGLIKTYSANNRVTDSGASGTAYATGVKTNNSYIGVDPEGRPVKTILEKANDRGMGTGLVVSVGIVHATPAVFYAHEKSRNYMDIAPWLLDADMDVAIGGGRHFLEKENRKDGLDILKGLEDRGYLLAENIEGLDGVSHGKAMAIYPGELYGIPTMYKGRDPEYLSKATSKALEILTNNSRGKGFFLMVEGSLIDAICHSNDTRALFGEMRDFDNAVGVALDYAEAHPGTLVIILADHETGGLSIPSGNTDFLQAESGIGFKWGTTGHSATMVPVFSYGPRAEYFGGILENDEVGRRMQEVLGLH